MVEAPNQPREAPQQPLDINLKLLKIELGHYISQELAKTKICLENNPDTNHIQ